MKKHNIIFYISIIIILVTLAFCLSYAYLIAIVKGNTTATKTQAQAGSIKVEFSTSDYINNTSLMLIQDAERATKAEISKFSLSNTSTNAITTRYDIYLTNLTISDNFKSTYFKWELLKNDTILDSGNFTTAVTGTDFKLNTTTQTITASSIDNYILRIWLSESGTNQLSLTNGNFAAKVKIISVASN